MNIDKYVGVAAIEELSNIVGVHGKILFGLDTSVNAGTAVGKNLKDIVGVHGGLVVRTYASVNAGNARKNKLNSIHGEIGKTIGEVASAVHVVFAEQKNGQVRILNFANSVSSGLRGSGMNFISCSFQRIVFDQTLSRPAAAETGVSVLQAKEVRANLKLS